MSTHEGHAGSVTFDGSTVTIEKRLRGRVQFPVSAISSVMLVPAGIGMSGIKFTVSGGVVASTVHVGGSHKDIAQDPYALTFRKKKREAFEALVSEIQAAQVRAPRP